MATIKRRESTSAEEIKMFLMQINFNPPQDFIDFFKVTNGAEIFSDRNYVQLWSINYMIQLNMEYHTEEYIPEFFIFGSDGADTAFVVKKSTGEIYEMPFIGMSNDEAIFNSNTFTNFLSCM